MHHFSCICEIYQEINHHPLNFQTIPLDSTSVASSAAVFCLLGIVTGLPCPLSSSILVYLGLTESICWLRDSLIPSVDVIQSICEYDLFTLFTIYVGERRACHLLDRPGMESMGFTRTWLCDARWRQAIIYL